MVTLSKIIDGLEMVDDIVDCYYNPEKEETPAKKTHIPYLQNLQNARKCGIINIMAIAMLKPL